MGKQRPRKQQQELKTKDKVDYESIARDLQNRGLIPMSMLETAESKRQRGTRP